MARKDTRSPGPHHECHLHFNYKLIQREQELSRTYMSLSCQKKKILSYSTQFKLVTSSLNRTRDSVNTSKCVYCIFFIIGISEESLFTRDSITLQAMEQLL